MELVSKRGAFYSYGDVRLGQGRENAKQFLRENPDICQAIEATLRDELGLAALPVSDEVPAVDASGDGEVEGVLVADAA